MDNNYFDFHYPRARNDLPQRVVRQSWWNSNEKTDISG